MRRGSRVVMCAVIVVLALAGCSSRTKPATSAPKGSAPAPAAAPRATVAWQQKLTPIGQPLVADGVAVVEATDSQGLTIVAMDAATGKRLWWDRANAGDVLPGIEVRPALVHGKDRHERVAYYRPNLGHDLEATLVVADLRTGREVATAGPSVFGTPPDPCDDGRDVCVTEAASVNDYEYPMRLDITHNRLLDAPENAPAGFYDIGYGLLQSITDGPKTLSVMDGRRVRWQHPLAQLFPGGHTPDGGWAVLLDDRAQIYVVALGSLPKHGVRDLSRGLAMAGLDARTGRRLWLQEGTSLWCNGHVTADDAKGEPYPVRCRYRGTQKGRQDPVVTDAAVEGLDVRTGRTTWTVPAGPAGILFGGKHVPGSMARAGASSFLLAVPGRPSVVIDLANGRTRAPAMGDVFPCERQVEWTSPETFHLGDGTSTHQWDGGSVMFACDASGKATSGQPSWNAAAAVGSTAGKLALIATADHIVALAR